MRTGRRPARYHLRWIALLTAVLTATVGGDAPPAQATSTAPEQVVYSLIQRARTTRGLPALTLSEDLSQMAHQHSQRMARERQLFHTACLACRLPVTIWSVIAENVGSGGSLRRIHRMMMRSADHRANILGQFLTVGVGVVKRGNRFWVTEVFLA